jgi:peptidoglycan/xylan/chitin deacetylase (PgdA/CDA1 family)
MILSSSIRLFASILKQLVMALLVLTILIVLVSNVHLDNVMVFGSEDHNKIGSVYQNSTKTSINNLNKLIILTFGDISQTQYTNAKPILDKYGFKGSFFVTCDWAGTVDDKSPRMSWQMIQALHSQGQDVESKAVTHRDLNSLSYKDLEFEISQSKKCLADHGITATIFAVPN